MGTVPCITLDKKIKRRFLCLAHDSFGVLLQWRNQPVDRSLPLDSVAVRPCLQNATANLDALQRDAHVLQVVQQLVKVPLTRAVVTRLGVDLDQSSMVDNDSTGRTHGPSAQETRVVELALDLLCHIQDPLWVRHINVLGLVSDPLLFKARLFIVIGICIRKNL